MLGMSFGSYVTSETKTKNAHRTKRSAPSSWTFSFQGPAAGAGPSFVFLTTSPPHQHPRRDEEARRDAVHREDEEPVPRREFLNDADRCEAQHEGRPRTQHYRQKGKVDLMPLEIQELFGRGAQDRRDGQEEGEPDRVRAVDAAQPPRPDGAAGPGQAREADGLGDADDDHLPPRGFDQPLVAPAHAVRQPEVDP